jgi:hypothetical protein
VKTDWQRGTAGELTAAVYLMDHGCEVFLGLGPTSCDLIAILDGRCYRVEVKRTTLTVDMRWNVPWCRPSAHDWLLLVDPKGTVVEDYAVVARNQLARDCTPPWFPHHKEEEAR